MAGQLHHQIHELIEGFFTRRHFGQIVQHGETTVGLVIQSRSNKRRAVQIHRIEQVFAMHIAVPEDARIQFKFQAFQSGFDFTTAHRLTRHQMNGNGLVYAHTQLVHGFGHLHEGIGIGHRHARTHLTGKLAHLLGKLGQILTRRQAFAADALQAHHKALVIHAWYRLCQLETAIHGATHHAKMVAIAQAWHGVQLACFAQRHICHVIDTVIKPRQFHAG